MVVLLIYLHKHGASFLMMSVKYATLQEKNVGTNPVLIRIDTKSGHGASNLSKAIESMADQYAFTWYNMDIVPPLAKKDM